MKKTTMLTFSLAALSAAAVNPAWSMEVTQNFDAASNCTRYIERRIDENSPIPQGETLYREGIAYGFYFRNLTVDFNARTAGFDIYRNIPLTKKDEVFIEGVTMSASDPLLPELLRIVNSDDWKDVSNTICIGRQGNLVYWQR